MYDSGGVSALYDVGKGPLEVAAQAAGLDQRFVRPVTQGETLVAARALLVAEAHLAALFGLLLWFR